MLTAEDVTDEMVRDAYSDGLIDINIKDLAMFGTILERRAARTTIATLLNIDLNTRAANAIEGDGHIRVCGNGGSDPADCSPECARVNARAAKSEASK